jgi:hypothetical protein
MFMSIEEYDKYRRPTIAETLANPHLLNCLRCGWFWLLRGAGPDGEDMPVCCPHCKSGFWDRPRKHYLCINCRRFGAARDCQHCAQIRAKAVAEVEAQGKRVCPRCKKYGPVPKCRSCDWLNGPAPVNEQAGSALAEDEAGVESP